MDRIIIRQARPDYSVYARTRLNGGHLGETKGAQRYTSVGILYEVGQFARFRLETALHVVTVNDFPDFIIE